MDLFQQAMTQLSSSLVKERNAAIHDLHKLRDPRAIAPLIHVLLHDPSQYPRARAAKALRDLGDGRAVDPLLAALHDPGSFVRAAAARALGKQGTSAVIPSLVQALHDSNYAVHGAAAQALGERRAIDPLIAVVFEFIEAPLWEVHSIRVAAVYALAALHDPRADRALIQALGDFQLNIQGEIALCLGRSGNTEAVDPLLETLTHPSPVARWDAAQALGQIGDRKAIPPLIRCLSDENSTVRSSALAALGQLDAIEAVEMIRGLAENEPEDFTRNRAKRILRELEERRLNQTTSPSTYSPNSKS